MTDRELKDRLTSAITLLNIPGVGRGRYLRLVDAFGGPQKALVASISDLEKVSGISRKIASDIKSEQDRQTAAEIASRVIQLGWTVSFYGDVDYPKTLLPINSPPAILFSLGLQLNECDRAIAIVGTRNASDRGKLFAYNLASALVRAGVVVVSGMADGIDSAAHKGALEAGGQTIAVWGASLDIVYPPGNKGLAESIINKGTVCSEYLPGTNPDRASFPERNRIISGLSAGVVVVEAGKKSGALLTADHALEQGRELFAVPGHPDYQGAAGTNELIRKGARLLTSVDDIFEELPRLHRELVIKRVRDFTDMTDTERKIIDLFTDGPIQLDKISRAVDLPVSDIMEFMLALELKGVVRELSGKRFVLTDGFS